MTAIPNLVRTLLLNEARGAYGPDFFGEEYVSLDYLARQLPTAMRKTRAALFGGDPDRHMLNFRLHQLMQVMHSTEAAEYMTFVDPRITYLPLSHEEFWYTAFQHQVMPAGSTAGELTPIGTLEPDEKSGRIFYNWRIEVIDNDYVNVQNLIPPLTEQVYEYTFTSGLSNLIPLIGSSLWFNFRGVPGDVWYIETIARPTKNTAEILASLDRAITLPDETVIFGDAREEPWKTWRAMWKLHDMAPYRLTGLLLAMAYRTATYKPPAPSAAPPPVPPTPPEPPEPPEPSESSVPSSVSSSSEGGPGPPPVLTGLEGWYDGQDSSTLTVVGSNISQWDDKSGAGNDVTQATGADQPTISTLNGYQALAFDGSGQHLDGVSWSQQSPTTLFVVYQMSSPLKGATATLVRSAGSDRIRYQKRTTGDLRRMHENSDLVGTIEDTNAHYATCIFNDVSSSLRIDGAVDVSGSVGTRTPSSDGLSIGATPGGTEGMQGTIGEVLWYDALLNATEISQVEAWLKDKWGL
jgi:hypothetical protein